ncbi:MAG: hypothetical protein M3Q99_17705, partial [Acidobacteriota bacterium]|nr:hypothetical protein [Acidobacteriota bacterium]
MSSRINNLIEQVKTDAEEKTSIASARRDFADETEAKSAFFRFGEKLLRIERWNAESGISSFALFNTNGDELLYKPA